MKKGLLTILGSAFITFGAFSQVTYPACYDQDLWQVDDSMTVVDGLTGLVPSNDFDSDPATQNVNNYNSQYSYSWVGDVLKIDFTQSESPQYNNIALQTIQWDNSHQEGASSEYKFMKSSVTGADTTHVVARGQAVDFSKTDNAIIRLKYQTTEEVYLRVDMVDIDGKTTNDPDNGGLGKTIASTGTFDAGDDSKWVELTFSWDNQALVADLYATGMADLYSPDWWGEEATTTNDNPCSGASAVPLDMSRIVKMAITLNDGTNGTVGDVTELYLKDIEWGNRDVSTLTTFELWGGETPIETVEGAELEVNDGVVSSEGTITVMTVTGQVVATAEGQLDLSTVPAGVYVIVTPEGTAKIVK